MKAHHFTLILIAVCFSFACNNENGQVQEPFSVDTTPIEMYVGDIVKIKAKGAAVFKYYSGIPGYEENNSSMFPFSITEDGVLTAKLAGYAEVLVQDKNNRENTAVVPIKIMGRHPLISSIIDYELITYWMDRWIDRKVDIEKVKNIFNSNQCTEWEYKKFDLRDVFYNVGDVFYLEVEPYLVFRINYDKMEKVEDFLIEHAFDVDMDGEFVNGIGEFWAANYRRQSIMIQVVLEEDYIGLYFKMNPK